MNTVKVNRMALTLCSLFSLLVVVIGTTGVAHAVAGAQSSALVTVDPFNDPRTTVNRMTTEVITTATSPNVFVINSTQRDLWEDVLPPIESSVTDGPYNAATGTAYSSGSTVSQLSLALADGMGGYSAEAQTVHDVDFLFTGTAGELTVSGVYDVFMQIYNDNANESVSGYLLAGIYLRNIDQLSESSDVVILNYLTETFTTLQGPLSATLAFASGDHGSFRVIVDGRADAYSSVPEPSTLALLGFGLVGAALLRKRIRS
jgi:hypothetical protein